MHQFINRNYHWARKRGQSGPFVNKMVGFGLQETLRNLGTQSFRYFFFWFQFACSIARFLPLSSRIFRPPRPNFSLLEFLPPLRSEASRCLSIVSRRNPIPQPQRQRFSRFWSSCERIKKVIYLFICFNRQDLVTRTLKP